MPDEIIRWQLYNKRKSFFIPLLINLWKSLLQAIVEANSITRFKKGLQKINGQEIHQGLLSMTARNVTSGLGHP